MKQITFSFKWLVMSLLLGVSVGAWAEDSYKITFGNSAKSATAISTSTKASTVISSGTSYVTSSPFTIGTGKSYYGDTQDCIRLGQSGSSASLTIALSDDGKVKASTIVVACKNYGGNKNTGAKLSINGSDGQTTSDSEKQNLSFTINDDITAITLSGDKAIYVYSITVNYGTAHDDTREAAELAFTKSDVELDVDASTTIGFSKKTTADVTFTVADPTIASYDAETGTITALKPGTTTLVPHLKPMKPMRQAMHPSTLP